MSFTKILKAMQSIQVINIFICMWLYRKETLFMCSLISENFQKRWSVRMWGTDRDKLIWKSINEITITDNMWGWERERWSPPGTPIGCLVPNDQLWRHAYRKYFIDPKNIFRNINISQILICKQYKLMKNGH